MRRAAKRAKNLKTILKAKEQVYEVELCVNPGKHVEQTVALVQIAQPAMVEQAVQVISFL